MVDGRNNSKDSEHDILKRAMQGEASAFGLLYDIYQPKIYRFIYLKVSNSEEAEDLTHQVFLSAWEHISRFVDQQVPISSWLYQIARNKVIDHYRTRRIQIPLEDSPESALIAEHDDVGARVQESMDKELVRKHLQRLPQDYQDIIIMKFVEDLSNTEIAAATGKNAGALRVLQHRALKQLKKLIEEDSQ